MGVDVGLEISLELEAGDAVFSALVGFELVGLKEEEEAVINLPSVSKSSFFHRMFMGLAWIATPGPKVVNIVTPPCRLGTERSMDVDATVWHDAVIHEGRVGRSRL